jgi:predicted transcriptional regulator
VTALSGQQGGRRAAGELERAILAALWAAGTPLSPTQLQAALGGALAYNTVHTIITRLVDKGLIARQTDRGRAVYSPVKDAAEIAAERMRGALETGGDRELVLRRFVTLLNDDDERALRALLNVADERSGGDAR